MNISRIGAGFAFLIAASVAIHACIAYAYSLTYVSDLISTSVPSASATHIIQFTASHDIPPSGHIAITLQPGAFSIPAGLDYTDMEFSVSSGGGPYVDRSIADAADASHDGVAVTAGVNGNIVITLNSSAGISAHDMVRISIGTTGAGVSITNPAPVGSYVIAIATTDASNAAIDSAAAMIAVVTPVSLDVPTDLLRPTIFNGLPAGEVAAGNATIELSLQTLDWANCRYATTSGIAYDYMQNSFSSSDGVIFYTDLTGFVDGQAYTFYVRCINNLGNPNDTDYPISFYLDPTPSILTSSNGTDVGSEPGEGYLGPGGEGSYPNGSAYLYESSVMLTGFTIPLSSVTVVKDGAVAASVQSKADGTFSALVNNLERGTYTFSAFTADSQGDDSAAYSASLSLAQGTNNSLSNILIPPTLSLSSASVSAGDALTSSGGAMPDTQIEIDVRPTAAGSPLSDTHIFYATSTLTGSWSAALDTSLFADGSYVASAREIQSDQSRSDWSTPFSLDVGGSPSSCSNSTDLNNDHKVNLIDFSIFLTFWNTTGPRGDFNCDGTVNLADFSILLYHWTG